MHPLGVLPGQQHLGGRSGTHRQLGSDGNGVAQAGGPLGGCDTYAVFALTTPQLSRFAGDISESGKNRARGGQQSVFAGRGRKFRQTRAEHKAPLHIARDQTMVFESDGESMRGRSGQSGARNQPGQGGWSSLEG